MPLKTLVVVDGCVQQMDATIDDILEWQNEEARELNQYTRSGDWWRHKLVDAIPTTATELRRGAASTPPHDDVEAQALRELPRASGREDTGDAVLTQGPQVRQDGQVRVHGAARKGEGEGTGSLCEEVQRVRNDIALRIERSGLWGTQDAMDDTGGIR